MWKDIKTGNDIRIHSENEYNGKEGMVISNFSDTIRIYINEDEELELDLSQGLPPDSKIYDIEKIDSVLEEEIEENPKDAGFEIVGDIKLDDIMESVPIPEEERLYSNQEEFNDMFEQLINKERPENINYLLENKLKRSIDIFFKLKDETTLYSQTTGKVLKVINKQKGFKPLCKEILNNNFHNISYIPIVSNKKTDKLGYNYIVKEDINTTRNCFDGNNCEYINEKVGNGLCHLDFSEQKALSGYERPNDNVIEIDNNNTFEKVKVFNPENINIVGFITFPEEYYNNKNINNVNNLKKLYSKNENLYKIWENKKNKKIVKKINLSNNGENNILNKADIGKDFILTLDDGSGDDLVYEVKFINID